MRINYKYPHAEFPYAALIEENRKRSRTEPEFELWDTGIFGDHRYFDIDIEYAKASQDDLLCRITVRCQPSGFETSGAEDAMTRSLGSNAKRDLGRLLRAAPMRLPEPTSSIRISLKIGCFPKTRRISNTSTPALTQRLYERRLPPTRHPWGPLCGMGLCLPLRPISLIDPDCSSLRKESLVTWSSL
jgi:hypothetical protein